MADTRMNQSERETFLAGLHVGVLSIAQPDPAQPPLSAPIWYAYQPAGDISLLIGKESRKGALLSEGTRVTLVAQQEALPYAYVSVEGVVSSIRPATADDTRAMAQRYLGEEMGAGYAEANAGDNSVCVSIQPQRWLTVDYAKST